jgi:hypothetical protein
LDRSPYVGQARGHRAHTGLLGTFHPSLIGPRTVVPELPAKRLDDCHCEEYSRVANNAEEMRETVPRYTGPVKFPGGIRKERQ